MSWLVDFMDTINVYRKTNTSDGIGGFTVGETLSHTIQGYIALRNIMSRERGRANQLDVEVTHDLFCLPGENVQSGDVLEYRGRRYRVIAVREVYDPLEKTVHHLLGEIEEVQ